MAKFTTQAVSKALGGGNGKGLHLVLAVVLGAGAGGGGGSIMASRELQDHLTRIQKLEEISTARQTYITEFQQVQAMLELIHEDLKVVKKWQADWPSQGELRLDTIQRKDIDQLRKEVDALNEEIKDLRRP